MSKKLSISKAIGEALHEEMARDENVIIMGEDMGKMGNVFGITVGFQEEFGENRVFDTPISESGFCGMAVGAAMRGIRPVVEMYDDFITVAADPIINQAAKMRYMTGGQATVPMVLRLPMGAGRRNAGQHSQCFENIFCHTPGLKVVAPSSAEDAKGLLKSAIRDAVCKEGADSRRGIHHPSGCCGCEKRGYRYYNRNLEPRGILCTGGSGRTGEGRHQRRGSGSAYTGSS